MYMCVWAAFEYYKCRNESSRDSVVILNVTHHLTKSSVTSCTNGKVFDANIMTFMNVMVEATR